MKPLNRTVRSGRILSLTPPARLLLTLILSAVLGTAISANSATNVVTSLADSGAGSLRQGLAGAAPGDCVVFAVNGTISLASGELVLAKDLSVFGPGAPQLAIGGGAGRILNVGAGATVVITGLTIRDGRTADGVNGTLGNNGGSSAPGGGILNAGSLTLRDCVITGNRTGNGGDGFSPPIPPNPPHTPPTSGGSSGNGGAIHNSGTLCLSNCVIANNTTGRGGARSHNDTYWSSGGTAGNGGAIYSVGTLTLIHSIVSGNHTGSSEYSGASGGGIWSGGNCFADQCVVSNNATAGSGGLGSEGGNGGGIYSQGLLALTNCTVSRNWCGGGSTPSDCFPPGAGCGGGMGGSGGGIYSANCVLVGCTINHNNAGGGGMGGFAYTPPYPGGQGGTGGDGGGIVCGGAAFLTNCTITGNLAGGGGEGGFALYGSQGVGGNGGNGGGIRWWSSARVVVACTIVSNAVGGPGWGYLPGAVGNGGGMFDYDTVAAPGGFLNNIVARNAGPSPDVSGPFTSLGYNLIGITNGSIGFTAMRDRVGSSAAPLDPQVASLADNGGPTPTMALRPGSPAIEAGTTFGVPATDQRGVARPQGSEADIGSFEFEFIPQIIAAHFQSASAFWLESCGLPNESYTVQFSVDLTNWLDLTNICTGANGLCEHLDCNLDFSSARFYRLKSVTSPSRLGGTVR